jgi:hypothetical protein
VQHHINLSFLRSACGSSPTLNKIKHSKFTFRAVNNEDEIESCKMLIHKLCILWQTVSSLSMISKSTEIQKGKTRSPSSDRCRDRRENLELLSHCTCNLPGKP